MRSYCDRISRERGMNYTLIATPAEGLSGRFVRIDRERYGVIPASRIATTTPTASTSRCITTSRRSTRSPSRRPTMR